jgi:hypothetical protein
MVNGRFDAAITSCVVAGAMAWVSFVDCAVFSKLARSGESKALTKIFSAWWPAGKAFMMPALGCAVGSQVWAYVETERNKLYLLSAGSLVSIGLWTRAIMWDDINHLLAATGGGGTRARPRSISCACTTHASDSQWWERSRRLTLAFSITNSVWCWRWLSRGVEWGVVLNNTNASRKNKVDQHYCSHRISLPSIGMVRISIFIANAEKKQNGGAPSKLIFHFSLASSLVRCSP